MATRSTAAPKLRSPAPQRKAYSYLRFSTPEQMKGDSFRRQTEAAAAYARKHGLTLDTELTFQDLGVSAFRGKNAQTGKLGEFLQAVQTGHVAPGSVLLVESLDRVSRNDAYIAMNMLTSIIMAGIAVVTLMDGKEYSHETLSADPTAVMFAVLIFIRANEESATKAARLKAAWEGKRERAAQGGALLTSILPAWLTKGDDGKPEVIEERAEVVRRIFREYIAGTGAKAIAKGLNVDGVEPFGNHGRGKAKQWHGSYIQKILRNPAVVGVNQPMTAEYVNGKKVRRPAAEPIKGYFPAVVDEAVWQTVQAMVRDTKQSLRGKASSKDLKNLFGGFGVCGRCGATMTRVSKGRKKNGTEYAYLVCTKAKYGEGCKYEVIQYQPVEDAFLGQNGAILAEVPLSAEQEDSTLGAKLRETEAAIEGAEATLGDLRDAYVESKSRTILAEFQKVEAELETLEDRRMELAGQLESASGPLMEGRLADLKVALAEDELDRKKVNALMRSLLSRVEFHTEQAQAVLVWKHGGETAFLWGFPKAGE